jgi:hypothetical protein
MQFNKAQMLLDNLENFELLNNQKLAKPTPIYIRHTK